MQTLPLFDTYSLRPICGEDAADIFQAIDTQRAYLGRWLPFVATTQRVEQTREVVDRMQADTANPVFTLRNAETFVGLIGFKEAAPTTGSIEIGYWLREEFQGRGLMTAAVRTLCSYAFTQLGMHTVRIRCGTGNAPSNRIPRQLGFRLDRIEAHGEELTDGEWIDLNVYLLDRD